MKEKILETLKKLRVEENKRGFVQSVDLIINLRDIDLRKAPISLFFSMPNKTRVPKVCAFLEKKSDSVDRAISKAEMTSLDKKQIKSIGKEFDFFLSSAPLMGQVATVFGKTLGPLGKMPNPKTGGVIMVESEDAIKAAVIKLKNAINIKVKEPSIKVSVGKEDMDDEKLSENILAVYNNALAAMPNKKENIRSVMLKLTMSKPLKVEQE